MQPLNSKEPDLPEFIRRFGQAAGKKAARYQAGRRRGEQVDLVDPEAARLGQEIRSVRMSQGLTRRDLAVRAGVDYTLLVLLEHGLLEPTDDGFEDTRRQVMAALGVEEAGSLEGWKMDNGALSARRQGVPAYLAWGKKLLLCLDFLFLALIVWLFGRWTGGDWPSSPALWLAVAGGIIFLAGEKLAAHYWALAGRRGDRAYALPPGAEKTETLWQRNRAETRFRRSIGVGGMALLLAAGPIYLPVATGNMTGLLAALAGAALFSGYRILALAYWRDAARWRNKMAALLQDNELRRTIRNRHNAYRLFWLCALCMVVSALSIFLPLWSVILAQVLLGAALLLLGYLGVRYALGRYYVDIDLMVQL